MIDFAVSDPDNDPLQVQATDLPANATLEATTINNRYRLRWTPTSANLGSHSITITATDDGRLGTSTPLTTTRNLTWIVRAQNQPPTLSILGTRSVAEGDLLTVVPSAVDPDIDTLFWTAQSVDSSATNSPLPVGFQFNATNGSMNWRPTLDQAGVYTIRVTVTDGAAIASEDLVIHVTQVNREPVFPTYARLTIDEGQPLHSPPRPSIPMANLFDINYCRLVLLVCCSTSRMALFNGLRASTPPDRIPSRFARSIHPALPLKRILLCW